MIKTIIFDYGGVLGPDASDWESMYQRIGKVTNLSNETISHLWAKHKPQLLYGQTDLPDFFEIVAQSSKQQISSQKLLKIYFQDTYVDKDTLAFAKNLKKKGYKMLILSNETKSGIANKIKKFKLKDIFEKVYCSAELGMTKREPKIFEYVLQKEKIKPEETLFIDDRIHNVENAASVGIQAIHFLSLEDLKKRMENFGI